MRDVVKCKQSRPVPLCAKEMKRFYYRGFEITIGKSGGVEAYAYRVRPTNTSTLKMLRMKHPGRIKVDEIFEAGGPFLETAINAVREARHDVDAILKPCYYEVYRPPEPVVFKDCYFQSPPDLKAHEQKFQSGNIPVERTPMVSKIQKVVAKVVGFIKHLTLFNASYAATLIEASEKYADDYGDTDIPASHIKATVMNAFYAGSNFSLNKLEELSKNHVVEETKNPCECFICKEARALKSV